MAATFRALLATKDGDRQNVAVTELTEADLMDGDVTVAVEHSTVNYKDGLAITGKVPIIRKFPLIPGVDLAGRVLRSEDPRPSPRLCLWSRDAGRCRHAKVLTMDEARRVTSNIAKLSRPACSHVSGRYSPCRRAILPATRTQASASDPKRTYAPQRGPVPMPIRRARRDWS